MSDAEEHRRVLEIIDREKAGAHVAMWYIEAMAIAWRKTGLWLKWRKDGRTLDRRDNVSRIVDDFGKALGWTREDFRSEFPWWPK